MTRIARFRGYALAPASVLLALIVTRWIGPDRAGVGPLFFAAVVVATWRGGLGPGLLATVLSVVAIVWFLFAPVHSLAVVTDDVIRMLVFVAVAILISYLHDSADRARARAQEAQRQADLASRAKDRLLAAVSHDLRNPLNAILLWTQILERSADDPALRCEALAAIRGNAEAQARLVEDLMDTVRIAAGKMGLDIRPVDLVQILRAAVSAARPVIEQAGLNLDLALPREPRMVLADPDRVRQILGNLLGNAVKFSDPGGRIRISLDCDHDLPGQARVTVSDQGRGIHPDFLPHVFDRFAQQDHAPVSKLGLGLGLSIARHLVERQGGSISAHSDGPGRGAAFTFTLPLSTPAAVPVPTPGRREPEVVAHVAH